MGSYASGLRIRLLLRILRAPPQPPLDRRPNMLRAHEYRRVALLVVQQPVGILHEALRAALVPAHSLGVGGLGLGKEPDVRVPELWASSSCYMSGYWHPRAGLLPIAFTWNGLAHLLFMIP